jgi:hypothetical protein
MLEISLGSVNSWLLPRTTPDSTLHVAFYGNCKLFVVPEIGQRFHPKLAYIFFPQVLCQV